MLIRCIVILLSAITISQSCSTDSGVKNLNGQVFYYNQGQKIYLTKSASSVAIGFNSNLSFEEAAKLLSGYNMLYLMRAGQDQLGSYNQYYLAGASLAIPELIPGLSDEQISNGLLEIQANPQVAFANNMFEYRGKSAIGITDQFIVSLKSPADTTYLMGLANATKTLVVKPDVFMPDVYYVKVQKISNGNALEMANLFFETGKFAYVEPDFFFTDAFQ